jgi:hypothetical protein
MKMRNLRRKEGRNLFKRKIVKTRKYNEKKILMN